jgi:hypothetical protein
VKIDSETQLTTLGFWYKSLSSMVEPTGDCAKDCTLGFCGLPPSLTSPTVVLFLFCFPEPRPDVGTDFEGRISAIYEAR